MELREPRADRLRRTLTVVLAIIAAVAGAALYSRLSDKRSAPDCAQAYAAARTAADTALVDVQRASTGGGRFDAAYDVSCGELRHRGGLP